MKRLLRKISRLRIKTAEWQSIDINSPDLVQDITDAMAASTQIQIEYEGSGWRLIQPYGWNTSKAGNILLMCYKDTGEIRSYRLDRVIQVLVDDSLLTNEPVDTIDDNGLFEIQDYGDRANPEDFEIPELPNMDEILETSENELGQKLPFDDALDILTEEEIPGESEEILPEEPNPNDEEQEHLPLPEDEEKK